MTARAGHWLIALTLGAWVTAAPYLAARLGVPLPLALARLDGPHVYLGLALAVVLGLKIHHLRFRGGLAVLQGILPYQRWLSLGLLLTFGGVLASGALLVFPWPATVERQLVNLHLLTAGWAGLMTLAHAGRYLARRSPRLDIDARLVAGLLVLALPVAVLAALPRSVSPLSRLGAGAAWQRAGPAATMTRLVLLPGGELVAAGSGLAVSRDHGATWQAVPGLAETVVRGVAAPPSGTPVYVATERGVLAAGSPLGPYAPTGLSTLADSILVDADGRLWAGGAGLWTSTDGGATWSAAEAGLTPEGSIWTLGRFGGELLAGGTTGIYRWSGSRWDQVSTLRSVYSLDPGPGGEVWASSMGYGLQVWRQGRWRPAGEGLAADSHGRGTGVHVDGFLALGSGRALAATMDQGVAASDDGGATWSALSPGFRPGDVWQLLPAGDRVLAATDSGIYAYPLAPAPGPGAGWWAGLLLAALLVPLAAGAFALRPGAAVEAAPRRVPAGAGGGQVL